MNQEQPQLTLILGGARSGKSTYAQTLAMQNNQHVLFVATAEPGDEEMSQRIAAHRASRPPFWTTLEIPLQVGWRVTNEIQRIKPDLILLDCITLLTSNLLLKLPEAQMDKLAQPALETEINELISTVKKSSVPWIIVSNEVGLGLVPEYPLGRIYRDSLGWANQALAGASDRVIFMVSGIPMLVKPEKNL